METLIKYGIIIIFTFLTVALGISLAVPKKAKKIFFYIKHVVWLCLIGIILAILLKILLNQHGLIGFAICLLFGFVFGFTIEFIIWFLIPSRLADEWIKKAEQISIAEQSKKANLEPNTKPIVFSNNPKCSMCGRTSNMVIENKIREKPGTQVFGNLVGICPLCIKAFCIDHAPYDYTVDGIICPIHRKELDLYWDSPRTEDKPWRTGSKHQDVASQTQSIDNKDIKQEADLVSHRNYESDIKNQLTVIRSKFSILENAYVASNISTGPEEMEKIEKVLFDILSEGDIGLYFLIERLMVGVTFSGNNISLHNWGEDTTNELIKKQIIIKALGAAKVKGAIPELEKLSKANCNYSQWYECLSGPLNRAITAINS
jgi:hypothetical protein